jgi:hypothetical protein
MTAMGEGGGGVWTGGNPVDLSPAGGGPDNAIARWDGTTALQGSGVILSDADLMAFPGTGVIQLGDDPGVGAANPAAANGGLRMQGNGAVEGRIVFRNALDTGNIAGMSVLAGNVLSVGGPYPTRPTILYSEGQTQSVLRVAGANVLQAIATANNSWVPRFTFLWSVASPVIEHGTDGAAASVGELFTDHAQDVSGAGATVGGAKLVRAGDATAAVDENTGGSGSNRGGHASGTLASLGGHWGILGGNATAAGVGSVGGTAYVQGGTGETPGAAELRQSDGLPCVRANTLGAHLLRGVTLSDVVYTFADTPITIPQGVIVVAIDTTGGVVAATLPAASDNPGQYLCVKDEKSNFATSACNLACVAGDTVDNVDRSTGTGSPISLRNNDEAAWLHSDGGTNWRRV